MNMNIFDRALNEVGPGVCYTGEIKTKQDFETKCYIKFIGKELSHSPSDFGCTWEELQTKIDQLQAEWDAQEYARNRKEAYPDMGTQFNKIYDDGIDAWKTDMVDPVKAKFPKP
jgi:hypothetical protein